MNKKDDNIIIKAEIFRIIRANDTKTAKEIMAIIKEHFKGEEVSNETIDRALKELLETLW